MKAFVRYDRRRHEKHGGCQGVESKTRSINRYYGAKRRLFDTLELSTRHTIFNARYVPWCSVSIFSGFCWVFFCWLLTAVPCPLADASTCSNGIAGYQDGDICCLESCGQCGGGGCGTIPGTGGGSNCCPTTIREAGVVSHKPGIHTPRYYAKTST